MGDSMPELHKTSWAQIEPEKMNDLITRQMVNGENATVSRLLLTSGAVVPRHSHVSEQYSLIFAGNLKFIFDDREIEVKAGEVLYIPVESAAFRRGHGRHRGPRLFCAPA